MDGVIDVCGGRVRGRWEAGAWAFRGVPYARGPVGPLRWRPPLPPEPWSGVRDAVAPGPIAPQTGAGPGAGIPGDPVEQSEDCLHLSVWTPGLDEGRRPVMVWIHGGGFTSGTAGSRLYDGGHLSVSGDVVVVGVNYRLGALGFLAHPALDPSDGAGVGNWGLWDQIAALRWVRDHVAAFGGDPGNVTLFGESAGAMSVATLLAVPAARGLFHRAVVQSGPPYTYGLERAVRAAEELTALLGGRQVRREWLESVPAADLVAATATLQRRVPGPGELPLPLLPVVDGLFLPAAPLQAIASGAAADVHLVIGTNRDELAFFALSDPGLATAMDNTELLRRLALAAPDIPPKEVAALYGRVRRSRGEATSPRELYVAAGSDVVFRWPSLRLAAAQRRHQPSTFVYLFTWETPILDGMFGSCHALEIPFVFGTVRVPAVAAISGGGPVAERLSEQMQAAWLAFARSGDPSSDRGGEWTSWDPARRGTMLFGAETQLVDAPRDEELAVWQEAYPLDPLAEGVIG